MVNICLLGAVGVGKVEILHLFMDYIKSGLMIEINPDFNCTIIKADIFEETKTDYPSRVLIKDKGTNKSHTIFAPGGDIERTVIKMGITTISRICREIIAVFDLTQKLNLQLNFFTFVPVFQSSIYICFTKINHLAQNLRDKVISECEATIKDFFDKQHITINRFYAVSDENDIQFRPNNDALMKSLLDFTVHETNVNEESPVDLKTDLTSDYSKSREVNDIIAEARDLLDQGQVILRADSDAAFERLDLSIEKLNQANILAHQSNLPEFFDIILTEKTLAQTSRQDFEKKGVVYKAVNEGMVLLAKGSDLMNVDPLEAVNIVNKAIRQFSIAQDIASKVYPGLVKEIVEEKAKAYSIRDQFQRVLDNHLGLDTIQSLRDKTGEQVTGWILSVHELELKLKKIEREQKQISVENKKSKRLLTSKQDQLISFLDQVERMFREIINNIVVVNAGDNWVEEGLRPEEANNIKKRWKEGRIINPNHRLVDELTFDQYSQIMKGHRFGDSFKSYLKKDYSLILETLNTVREIRNNISHSKWHLLDIPNATLKVEFLRGVLRKYVKAPRIRSSKNQP